MQKLNATTSYLGNKGGSIADSDSLTTPRVVIARGILVGSPSEPLKQVDRSRMSVSSLNRRLEQRENYVLEVLSILTFPNVVY
jgi:hypothetical protein